LVIEPTFDDLHMMGAAVPLTDEPGAYPKRGAEAWFCPAGLELGDAAPDLACDLGG
jgi:hypothetical protein